MNDYLANTCSRSSEEIQGLLGPRNAACNRTIIVSKKANRRAELPEVFSENEDKNEDKNESNNSCELQGIIFCNDTNNESAFKSYDGSSLHIQEVNFILNFYVASWLGK
uniref:Uncharacterized protein n=1 Tax=Meloidogyne hapla TaxID=6305 RepID=A0A1I8BU18_MELHA